MHGEKMDSASSNINDPWRSGSEREEGAGPAQQGFNMPEFDPLESEKYLESLESRLNRIKGKTKEPTARDMLKSLGQMKDSQLKVLIDDSGSPYVSTHEPEEMLPQDHPALAALQRRIQPEKQALTVGELQRLVENDDLGKLAQTLTEDRPEGGGGAGEGGAGGGGAGGGGAGAEDSDKDIDESGEETSTR